MKPTGGKARTGHDRWLVSYADFVTLLFAFFVMMYAFARADQQKQRQVAEAIHTAFRSMGIGSSQPSAVPAPSKTSAVMNEQLLSPVDVKMDLERIQHELSQDLAHDIATNSVAISMGRDGLVISLREAGFFASGSATPKAEALPALREIAASLGQTPYDVRIEGHTDNVPIHTAQFDSNWELSTARATSIARLFLQLKAVTPDRLSAAGYAEFHPVASNDTPEGRAKNRRVDLVVMPRSRINFATMSGTAAQGPWRKITDGDKPANQPVSEPASQP